MILAAIGDLHLKTKDILSGVQPAILDAIVAGVAEAEPDIITLVGDLSGNLVPHKASIVERNEMVRFVDGLRQIAYTIIIRGNHDYPQDWSFLSLMDNVAFVDGPAPELIEIPGKGAVFALPWIDRSHFPSEADYSAAVRETYREAIAESRARIGVLLREHKMPTCLAGHVAIGGAMLREGQPTVATKDPLIDIAEMLSAAPFKCGVFGHYHFGQEVCEKPPGRYIGSVFADVHGEDHRKSWLLWDGSRFEEKPIAQKALVRLEVDLERNCVAQVRPTGVLTGVEGVLLQHVGLKKLAKITADIRIVADVPEERAVDGRTALRDLAAVLRESVTGTVEIAARVIRRARLREGVVEVTTAKSLGDKVRKYGAVGIKPPVGRAVLKRGLTLLDVIEHEMEG